MVLTMTKAHHSEEARLSLFKKALWRGLFYVFMNEITVDDLGMVIYFFAGGGFGFGIDFGGFGGCSDI